MTESQISLDRDGQRHEDRAGHGDVRHRMNEVGKDVSVDVGGHEEGPEGVGDAAEHDEEDVETGQSEKELVENVSKLRPRQNDEGQQVSHESGRPDDGHQDAVEPEPVVVIFEAVAAMRGTCSVQ